MDMFLFALEIIGTIAFAIGGSILGIKSKMDILGVIIIGVIAAMGGGLIRDITINTGTLVIFEYPIYLIISITTSVLVFLLFYFINKTIILIDNNYFNYILNIIDAIGLGVFVVVGANVGYAISGNLLLVIFCAIISAVGGGVIRDLMVNRIPSIFRKHIYCLAALVGCLIYITFYYFNLEVIGTISTLIVILVIRLLSLHLKLGLPKIQL